MKLLKATLVCSLIFLVVLLVYGRFGGLLGNDGEGGYIFHRYVKTSPAAADKFPAETSAQLQVDGFSPCSAPEGWFDAGAEAYWFKGSYHGSLPFYLRLVRVRLPTANFAETFDLVASKVNDTGGGWRVGSR